MPSLQALSSPRYLAFTGSVIAAVVLGALAVLVTGWSPGLLVFFLLALGLSLLGLRDLLQRRHAILRNYPVIGHLRFLFEEVRPELRQYFFETDKDGVPFSRDKRAIVYQRAKAVLDARPFGTQLDVYQPQYEWLHHSLAPRPVSRTPFRLSIGGADCPAPYEASLFNISAMSFGSLSSQAIMALNRGAKLGGFAHDTGEGGFSPYHERHGGDIIWELGSGYFGARNPDGSFSRERFADVAAKPQIKMIELKLSQGAKPGHGGVLPAVKITPEISRIRGISMGEDCISPAYHKAFSNPKELLGFIAELRQLSGGKPTGFKLCVGHPWEFLAVVKAMLETQILPDFIVVDGKEGGTGAAPLEFMDHLGMPLQDGLTFVHGALIGAGLRDRIRLGASGKIVTAFDMAKTMALGADWCNAARGFMFAVGCIQAQTCHTGKCPTGVTTPDPARYRAIVVEDKAERVANFHRETLEELAELVAAAGLDHPRELMPHHFMRRVEADRTMSFTELFPLPRPGELLDEPTHPRYREAWALARADSFQPLAPLAPLSVG
ncbi:MAG: FMN-binding glutamate synthase family protein [Hyphomicrobiaceae bacterium]